MRAQGCTPGSSLRTGGPTVPTCSKDRCTCCWCGPAAPPLGPACGALGGSLCGAGSYLATWASLGPGPLIQLAALGGGLALAGLVCGAWALQADADAAPGTGVVVRRHLRKGAAFAPFLAMTVQLRVSRAGAPLWVWAAVAFCMAAAGGALARSNGGTEVGWTVFLVLAAPGAAALAALDGRLVAVLGRQPFSLMRLMGMLVVPPVASVALAAGLAATVAGFGPVASAGFATALGALGGAAMALVVLHTLGGRARIAGRAAAADVALVGAMGSTAALGLATVLWAIARTAWLVRAARKRRWSDL